MDFDSDRYKDPATKDFTYKGSENAGTDEAKAGYGFTDHIPGESASSKETREGAYRFAKKSGS